MKVCACVQLALFLQADARPWAIPFSTFLTPRCKRYIFRHLRRDGGIEKVRDVERARKISRDVTAMRALELLAQQSDEVTDAVAHAHACVRDDEVLEDRLRVLPDELHAAALRSYIGTPDANADLSRGVLNLMGEPRTTQARALELLPQAPAALELWLDYVRPSAASSLRALARQLCRATQLRALTLRLHDDEFSSRLISAVARLTGLQALVLQTRHSERPAASVLPTVLASLSQLTRLELPDRGLSDAQIACALDALPQPGCLAALDIGGTFVQQQADQLTTSLQRLTGLTMLSLACVPGRYPSLARVGSGRFESDPLALLATLPVLPTLARLKLALCPVPPEHAIVAECPEYINVSSALLQVVPCMAALTMLDLSWHNVGANQHALMHALAALPRLHTLALYHANLDLRDGGTERMADAVAALPALRALDLGGLTIANDELPGLCKVLAAASGLTRLSLRWAALALVPDEFSAALASLQQLAWLDYSQMTLFTIEHAQALAPCLSQCTTLKRLDLSGNNLEGEICSLLGPALAALTGLEELSLQSISLSRPGEAEAWEGYLRMLPQLDVWRTLWSDEPWSLEW